MSKSSYTRMLNTMRALAQRSLPTSIAIGLRNLWEDAKDWVGVFVFGVGFVAWKPRPRVLVYFGYAPGDDLLCTAIFRELRRRGRRGLLMISDHRELFDGNQ